MQNAAQHPAVIGARLASEVRQQRIDRRPLRVVQPEQLRHDPGLSKELESDAPRSRQWIQNLKLDRVKRLKLLEQESSRLRRVVADLTLERLVLKEAVSRNYRALLVVGRAWST